MANHAVRICLQHSQYAQLCSRSCWSFALVSCMHHLYTLQGAKDVWYAGVQVIRVADRRKHVLLQHNCDVDTHR